LFHHQSAEHLGNASPTAISNTSRVRGIDDTTHIFPPNAVSLQAKGRIVKELDALTEVPEAITIFMIMLFPTTLSPAF